MKDYINRSWVAPIWIAYAFGLFVWAYRSRIMDIAKSAMPIIVLGLIRFMIVDFNRLSGGERIISLIIMGVLIFAGGYTYRKLFANKTITH